MPVPDRQSLAAHRHFPIKEVPFTKTIFDFANAFLTPYAIRGEKIVPEICPICHGGKNRDKGTFILNSATGGYVCQRGHCNAHGPFRELLQILGAGDEYHLEYSGYQRGIASRQYVFPEVDLLPPTEKILSYFKRRGISAQTLADYGVSADVKGNIVFPFYDETDTLVYVKYREPVSPAPKGKKEWQISGTKPILFGMNKCDPSLPLVITEGMVDALSLAESGVQNVTSVPSGCDNLDFVEHCWEWLERFGEIILFGDNDAPGQRMVETLIRRFGESRCKKVSIYPVGERGNPLKDANEVLVQCGEFTLMDMVDNAEFVPTKGLIDLSTVHPIDPTTIPRIKTGISALDDCIGGLQDGAVTVFTAKAGQGKSTLGGLLLLNAIEQGYKVCAYSGELSKEDFQAWIHQQAAGSDYITLKYDAVKGKKVPYVPPDVSQRIMDWYAGKFFLFDSNEVFEKNQSESVLNVFATAANRYGCKLFLTDNLMTVLSESDEETKAQGKFVAALKRFALRYHAHVIIVAHARKTKVGEKISQDDISGNSNTIKLAHSGIVVERPNLRVIKSRDSGQMRLIECVYCPDSRRIYQKDVGDKYTFSWDKSGVLLANPRADSMLEYQPQLAITQDPF